MAYSDDLIALGITNRFPLDGDATDTIASVVGVNSDGLFTGVPLCEGVTNSWLTNGITDRITIPLGNGIEDSSNQKSVGGWFSATGIQNPPKSIYGEGNTTQSLRFVLGWGNSLMFEIDTPVYTLQIFGDVPLEINRAYHIYLKYSGSEFSAFLDGVKQLNAQPINRLSTGAAIPARSVIEFGDPAGTVSVGGTEVILLAPINGQYNEWNMSDGTLPTDLQIREVEFEKGALPDVNISSQANLTTLADTVRSNAPLCIRETTSDGSTIDRVADNVTFDPLASIHVQYMGTGILNWTNTNGSNASIGSTPNGGTINFINPATLTVNGLIVGGEFRIYENVSDELDGIEVLLGTSRTFSHPGATNEIRIQLIADGFVEINLYFTLSATNQILNIIPEPDPYV